MAVEYMDFASCEPGLTLSPLPTWVAEAETVQIRWANQLAIELWNAADFAELLERRPLEGVPEKVLARTRDVVERVRAGKVVREEWTFYPKGETKTVMLVIQGITLPEGRLGLLMSALPTGPQVSESILRSVAMFRHTSVIAVLVADDGRILWRNPTAMQVFGETNSWLDWLVDREEGADILDAASSGEAIETRLVVSVRGELRWHQIEANALRDPVSRELGALIEHVDVSAEVEAEDLADSRGATITSLREALTLVERQRQEILDLSAPMLDVGNSTLAVPLIGRLDADQSEAITVRLLEAVSRRGIRRVILDVTGLATVDAGIAHRLHRMLAALRLLGAAPVITGARPTLALELAASGLDLGEVPTLRSLAEGLRAR